MGVTKELFGNSDGKDIYLFTLTNSWGMRAKVCTFGATLVALEVPDKTGNIADVCLGYDSLDEYIMDTAYFGGLIGRYANRIAKGSFILDGKEYKLATNNGPHHLHGGIKGFNKVVWQVLGGDDINENGNCNDNGNGNSTANGNGNGNDESSDVSNGNGNGNGSDKGSSESEAVKGNKGYTQITLGYVSIDGEEGYPGNLSCKVTYQLTEDNQLKITYHASTDKDTVINLTNHSYFNLAGQGNGDILAHKLTIYTDKYTIADDTLIPTGEIGSVKGTAFDFTQGHSIGERINQTDGGYDLNYVLNNDAVKSGSSEKDLVKAACVEEPVTGRVMEVYTTQPGMQFYTGNFLDGIKGKANKVYNKYYALCLETQHFPDSPNKPQFPSTILNPSDTYHHQCIYAFRVV